MPKETFLSTPEACLLTGLSHHTLRRRYLEGLVSMRRDPADRRRAQWERASLEAMLNGEGAHG